MGNIYKALFVALITGLFIIRPVSSYADWHGHDGHGHDHGYHGHDYIGFDLSVWPDNYYYGAPYYYSPADAVLVSPSVYQPVTVIQPPAIIDNQAQTVSPVITAATTNDMPDSITINIPNNKGDYTAVTLKKSGNGFIGPQGEFYTEFPKVSQLKVIYGK